MIGFNAGCANARAMPNVDPGELRRDAPRAVDYQYLLRGSKGPLPELSADERNAQACERGWLEACAPQ